MTRRDEFAKAVLRSKGIGYSTETLVGYVQDLDNKLAELDRTAPKEEEKPESADEVWRQISDYDAELRYTRKDAEQLRQCAEKAEAEAVNLRQQMLEWRDRYDRVTDGGGTANAEIDALKDRAITAEARVKDLEDGAKLLQKELDEDGARIRQLKEAVRWALESSDPAQHAWRNELRRKAGL